LSFCIAIPSKGHLDAKVFKLLDKYYQDLKPQTFVFTLPSDYEAYKQTLDFNIVKLPQDGKGIGFARHHIVDYCKSHNFDYVWMLDDAITNVLAKVNPKRYRVSKVRTRVFEEGVKLAQKLDISLLGVAFSFMGRFHDAELFDVGDVDAFALYKIDDVLEVGNFDNNLRFLPESDINFKLRLAKKKVNCWFEYAFNQKVVVDRTPEYIATRQKYIEIMLKRYPGIIKLWDKHDGFPRIKTNWRYLRNAAKFDGKFPKEV
jgi:hypothetical protein